MCADHRNQENGSDYSYLFFLDGNNCRKGAISCRVKCPGLKCMRACARVPPYGKGRCRHLRFQPAIDIEHHLCDPHIITGVNQNGDFPCDGLSCNRRCDAYCGGSRIFNNNYYRHRRTARQSVIVRNSQRHGVSACGRKCVDWIRIAGYCRAIAKVPCIGNNRTVIG